MFAATARELLAADSALANIPPVSSDCCLIPADISVACTLTSLIAAMIWLMADTAEVQVSRTAPIFSAISSVAWPLAWLTTRVYLRPRGHHVAEISASAALRMIDRPILLAHGSDDVVVPIGHLQRLAGIASAAGHPVETLTVPGGQHSWLYEFPEYRSIVAAFLSRVLGGPYGPEEAAARLQAAGERHYQTRAAAEVPS